MSDKNYYQDDRRTEKIFLSYLRNEASVNDFVKAVREEVENRMQRIVSEVRKEAAQKARRSLPMEYNIENKQWNAK